MTRSSPAPTVVINAPPLPPRCPFAAPGLDVSLCPGYTPMRVSTDGLGDVGSGVEDWTTCTHLGAERGRRGHYPGCHHPGGLPLAAPEVARSVSRRRGMSKERAAKISNAQANKEKKG